MIDEDILAKLISDKSGVGRREAQTQLDELAATIKSAVNTGEAFKVDHLGTFKKEDNATVFVPDEVLQTEINQKYAGMRPIELMGSFKETTAAQPVEPIEMPVEEQVGKETQLPDYDKNGIEPEPEQTEPVTEVEDEDKTEQKTSTQPERKENESAKTAESETGVASIILIIVAVISALILVGWLLYSMGLFTASQSAKPVSFNDTPVAAADQSSPQNDNLKTASLTVAESVSKIKTAGIATGHQIQAAVYGLRGVAQSKANDGYTIIVHSLLRKNKALEAIKAIKAKGYRTIMMNARVNGRLYWRVGIGQFKTIKNAKEAIKALPEPYKSNNFIKHQ